MMNIKRLRIFKADNKVGVMRPKLTIDIIYNLFYFMKLSNLFYQVRWQYIIEFSIKVCC